MDDDDSWLRWNDGFIPMSANSYVFNPTISPREIPNVRHDFRIARKSIRGANANTVGKLSSLGSFCISVLVNFLNI
jgi:hypothetical protein